MSKTAVITGASGGIGGAAARSLAAMGFGIVACYRDNEEAARRLAQEISEEHNVFAAAARVDLSRPEDIPRAAEEIKKLCGTPYALVNNGGRESMGLFQDLTDGELIEIMNADLVGTMIFTKYFLPDMIRAHEGRIVNVASVWGEVGASCETAYSAAKAGIIGFTKALAKECAPSGLTVNCVSPGFIDTRMNAKLSEDERVELIGGIPLCRAGTAEEAANAVAFLVSDKADYICGQTLRVDGAWI